MALNRNEILHVHQHRRQTGSTQAA